LKVNIYTYKLKNKNIFLFHFREKKTRQVAQVQMKMI